MNQSQIQLQSNNGNVFDIGGTTLKLNTNKQSVHICSVGIMQVMALYCNLCKNYDI